MLYRRRVIKIWSLQTCQSEQKKLKGIHIFSSFLECDCEPGLLTDYRTVEKSIWDFIKESDLTVFDTLSKNFSSEENQYGYSLIFGLLESHVAVHTYPESKALLLDVFACHHSRDNTDKAERVYSNLIGLFKPNKITNESKIQR